MSKPTSGAGETAATAAETTREVFEVFIEGTKEAVWAEVTRTEGLNAVFFNMQMDVDAFKPGGKFRMRSADGRYTGVVGEILEYDPPRRFVHTFKFTAFDDPPCKMIYELEEADGGVRFRLIADEIPTGTKTAKQLTGGGKMIVNTLKALVEKGKLPLGTRMLYGMIRVLGPITTPKRCRSEHWD